MTVVTKDSPSSSSPSQAMSSLPQYGFASEHSFEDLIGDNPFLFRVYTPKPRSPFFDSSEPFFVGHQSEDDDFSSESVDHIAANSTYEDVAKHMDWTTRSQSPYISTSFSFVWAVWEAVRRHRANVKHDIEIAVIDARAVSGKAVTALELLRKGTLSQRHRDYWKWYRFALEAQDVLVHGSIPGTAVFASIPIFQIIDRLPSYLLTEVSDAKMPFERLAWDYTERKPSYRQFCQDMSSKFLHMSADHRLRDTTAGSVRLALVFLRPWFHKIVQQDMPLATSRLRELSFVIAQWPGQWWVRDHAEIWDLTQLMVQTLAEEISEKQKFEVVEEVKTLQSFVDDLEGLVQQYEKQINAKNRNSRFSWTPKSLYPTNIPKRIEHKRSDTDTTLVDFLETKKLEKVIKVVDYAESTSEEAPSIPEPIPRPHSMAETVSCVCTGLLFGAFITMCIMNSQRRTLLLGLY